MIDLRDARVDHHLRVARDGHRAFENLRYKLLDQILAALACRRFRAEAAFFHDLIEQTLLQSLLGGRVYLRTLWISHWNPPPLPSLARLSAFPSFPYSQRFRAATLPACRCPADYPAGPTNGCAGPKAPSGASPVEPHFAVRNLPAC